MNDRLVILAVVYFLGGISVVLGVGAFVLVALSKNVPGEVWTLAGTSVGALASLLASTRSTPSP